MTPNRKSETENGCLTRHFRLFRLLRTGWKQTDSVSFRLFRFARLAELRDSVEP